MMQNETTFYSKVKPAREVNFASLAITCGAQCPAGDSLSDIGIYDDFWTRNSLNLL
jgi:hypothetical protein